MGGVSETILVVLIGRKETGQTDPYQLLQEEVAEAEGVRAGVRAEIVFAPGFDHLRVIRKRLLDAGAPRLDAVIVEPSSVSSMGLILKELKGKTGLVLLNAWSSEVEDYARGWGSGLPFGTVSTDHSRIGEIQGRQVAALLPAGGHVLCVTGPLRSSAAAGPGDHPGRDRGRAVDGARRHRRLRELVRAAQGPPLHDRRDRGPERRPCRGGAQRLRRGGERGPP